MRGIARYLVAAVVLALAGGACLAVGLLERGIARTEERVAGLSYDDPDGAYDRAERYFEYGSRLPWIGNGPVNEVRARKAALRYWRREYGALVPQRADPVAAISEDNADNVELQFIVANGVFRSGQAQWKDRQTTLQALDAGIAGYLTVLKSASRHEDAAYNYEYLLRLRNSLDKSGRKPGPSTAPSDSPFGRAGQPLVKEGQTNEFKIYIPLESDERKKSGEAGKSAPKGRKG